MHDVILLMMAARQRIPDADGDLEDRTESTHEDADADQMRQEAVIIGCTDA